MSYELKMKITENKYIWGSLQTIDKAAIKFVNLETKTDSRKMDIGGNQEKI